MVVDQKQDGAGESPRVYLPEAADGQGVKPELEALPVQEAPVVTAGLEVHEVPRSRPRGGRGGLRGLGAGCRQGQKEGLLHHGRGTARERAVAIGIQQLVDAWPPALAVGMLPLVRVELALLLNRGCRLLSCARHLLYEAVDLRADRRPGGRALGQSVHVAVGVEARAAVVLDES